jgi:hypothetical protein
MLNTEQREHFMRRGFVRIANAIPRDQVEAMADQVWAFLQHRDGIRRDDTSTWTVVRPGQFQQLQSGGCFVALANPTVRGLLDELIGAGRWDEPKHWGNVLVTFPRPGEWVLPATTWHLDYRPSAGDARLPALQAFALVNRVRENQGGTVAIAGSHLVIAHLFNAQGGAGDNRSADVCALLKRTHPWFRELWTTDRPMDRRRAFMDTATQVLGIDVQVVEFFGEPGEIILMHPWMVHAAAPNCGCEPRIMLSLSIAAHGQRPAY